MLLKNNAQDSLLPTVAMSHLVPSVSSENLPRVIGRWLATASFVCQKSYFLSNGR